MTGREGRGPERPGPDYPPEWDLEPEEGPCSTLGCPGDSRYAAPGRGHAQGCRYPLSEGEQ